MAFRVAATAFVLCLSLWYAQSKVYDRCELAFELREVHEIPEHQLATWLCIANYESHFNTSAHNPKSGDHGLFQISELYWCSPPGIGVSCGLPCAAFKDDDIEDDVICARRIYRQHQRISGDGFTAWVVYNLYCRDKQHVNSFLRGCFDDENLIRYGYLPAAMNLPTIMVPMPTSTSAKPTAGKEPSKVPKVQATTPKAPSSKVSLMIPQKPAGTSAQPSTPRVPVKTTARMPQGFSGTSARPTTPKSPPLKESPTPTVDRQGFHKPIAGVPSTTPKSSIKEIMGKPSSAPKTPFSPTPKPLIKMSTYTPANQFSTITSAKSTTPQHAKDIPVSIKAGSVTPITTARPAKISTYRPSTTITNVHPPTLQTKHVSEIYQIPVAIVTGFPEPTIKVSAHEPHMDDHSSTFGKSATPQHPQDIPVSIKTVPATLTTPKPTRISTYRPSTTVTNVRPSIPQTKHVSEVYQIPVAIVTGFPELMIKVSAHEPHMDDHSSIFAKSATPQHPQDIPVSIKTVPATLTTPKPTRISTYRPSTTIRNVRPSTPQTKHVSEVYQIPVAIVTGFPEPMVEVSSHEPHMDEHSSTVSSSPVTKAHFRTTPSTRIVSITPKSFNPSTPRGVKNPSSPVRAKPTTPKPPMKTSPKQPLANRFGSTFETAPNLSEKPVLKLTTAKPPTRRLQTPVTRIPSIFTSPKQFSTIYSSRGQKFSSTSKSPISSAPQTGSKPSTRFSSSSVPVTPQPPLSNRKTGFIKPNAVKPRQTKNIQFKFKPDEKVYAVINDSGYSYAISSRGFKLVWTGQ